MQLDLTVEGAVSNDRSHPTEPLSRVSRNGSYGQQRPKPWGGTSDRFGSNFPVPGRGWEGPESAQLSRSLPVFGMRTDAPHLPFALDPSGLAQSGDGVDVPTASACQGDGVGPLVR